MYSFSCNLTELIEAMLPLKEEFYIFPHVVCYDGAGMSVQAGDGLYSVPRNKTGPYSHFEVGYPTQPFPQGQQYKEDVESPDQETIFAYVPYQLIEEWIAEHGGIVGVKRNNQCYFYANKQLFTSVAEWANNLDVDEPTRTFLKLKYSQ